jgi:uncharacterized membrane protein
MRAPLVVALGSLVALPGALVLAEAIGWTLGHPALPAIEAVTGDWCHHDPARTLTVGGRLLPVCARCTGLYAGLALGPALGLLLPWQGRALARVAVFATTPALVALGAAFAEALGLLSTSNVPRLLLGLMLTTGPSALGIVGSRILAQALAEAWRERGDVSAP